MVHAECCGVPTLLHRQTRPTLPISSNRRNGASPQETASLPSYRNGTYREACDWSVIPLLLAVKGCDVDPFRDVDTFDHLLNFFQWTLDTVEDTFHDTRAELDRQRHASPEHRVADRHARRFLVRLRYTKTGTEPENRGGSTHTHTHAVVRCTCYRKGRLAAQLKSKLNAPFLS